MDTAGISGIEQIFGFSVYLSRRIRKPHHQNQGWYGNEGNRVVVGDSEDEFLLSFWDHTGRPSIRALGRKTITHDQKGTGAYERGVTPGANRRNKIDSRDNHAN